MFKLFLATSSLAALPLVHGAQCLSASPTAPTSNRPYVYAAGTGQQFDTSLCSTYGPAHQLVSFNVDPAPSGTSLIAAKLVVSSKDVDPSEDNTLNIGGSPVGKMTKGTKSGCWTKTELDVLGSVNLGQTHSLSVDVDNAGYWCMSIDWVALELTFQQTATKPPGVSGDPHFKTWSGEKYDFHGACDLVLLSNPQFENNLGLRVHIRTKQTRTWSYSSSVAIRIGEETLEIEGGADKNRYWINGASDEENVEGPTFPTMISGHVVSFKQLSSKSREFVVELENEAAIHIKTWNAYVSVSFWGATYADFGSSVGLMGSFPNGEKLARDNTTFVDDNNAFGQEWQVLASEPNLFHEAQHPQAPEQCEIPSRTQMRRRLGETLIAKIDAEVACARVSKEDFDFCVFDVMATNQKDAAGAY